MSKFQIVGSSLVGHGLSFEASALVDPKVQTDVQPDAERRKIALVAIADVVYREGRASVLLSYDDRYDLHNTVETLRALAVIVGPNAGGDRHRRASDIIARLLQEHEGGSR